MEEETGGWSVRRALVLMAVLQQTYVKYKRPRDPVAMPPGYRLTAAFKGKAYAGVPSTLAFLAESDRDAVLVFRGTIRTDEWVSDALIRQIPCPFAPRMGRIHEGFARIYDSVRGEMAEAIRSIAGSKTLYIAGHSLGGALAVLAAADLASAGRRPVVYTFGAPRVGDPRFACRFGRLVPESHRAANPHDLVTRLPPPVCMSLVTQAFYFYRHVPGLVRVEFRSGPGYGNHALRGYFLALARRDPAWAASLGVKFDAEDD
ncbi:MAG: hypothetical protein A9Z00_08075 [Thermobacillus sp. ZCTH02-B1]|uniref:lipase family protein n=1 Tax=Thermobacillus sp. ZCTH02-B1 TaxID=1858795 RepID=UPI000B57EBBA|nr:thioesterase domain-containing protein [Thermobacillus sp. ZCTH02-B1]OUM95312.1 MAG: hypothetical protein A9Z00_08075 [Thermobacillus sp. ZCTH02-B1]